MARSLSDEEMQQLLRPFPEPSSPEPVKFFCQARGCRTRLQKPWNCKTCGKPIKDMCASCHMELAHGEIPPPRLITAVPKLQRLGAGYDHIVKY